MTSSRMLKLGVLVVTWIGGCATQNLIPNTEIPDSPQNREVLQVVDSYRRAMEARDPARILMLVDHNYQDDAGTPDPEDDIDYQGLKKVLVLRLKRTEHVRYRAHYRAITFSRGEALVDAWIDATFVYKQPGTQPRYRRFDDYQRFHLVKDGDSWRFISGL